jgi:hypothetical protein
VRRARESALLFGVADYRAARGRVGSVGPIFYAKFLAERKKSRTIF